MRVYTHVYCMPAWSHFPIKSVISNGTERELVSLLAPRNQTARAEKRRGSNVNKNKRNTHRVHRQIPRKAPSHCLRPPGPAGTEKKKMVNPSFLYDAAISRGFRLRSGVAKEVCRLRKWNKRVYVLERARALHNIPIVHVCVSRHYTLAATCSTFFFISFPPLAARFRDATQP